MTSSEIITVNLENCRFFAQHGVMRQEQVSGNEFEVNISVRYLVNGPNDDNPDSTISYADLYEIAKCEMAKPRKLLETVARAISDRIEESWHWIEDVTVEIRKITPPIPGITGSASVKINRFKNHHPIPHTS